MGFGDAMGDVVTTQLKRKQPTISIRRDQGMSTHSGLSWRAELGLGEPQPIVIPDEVLAVQAHRINLKPADITSAVCGDPLPGESALDRMVAPAIAPAQEPPRMHTQINLSHVLSPRQMRRLNSNRIPTEDQRAALIATRDGGMLTRQRNGLWSSGPGTDTHLTVTIASCRKYGWLADAPGFEQAMKPCWVPVVITEAGLVAQTKGKSGS